MKDKHKQLVAKACLDYIPEDSILGVGTGSAVNFLIEELLTIKSKIKSCVASSIATEKKLRSHGFIVNELPNSEPQTLYIDGADSYNEHKQLVKGGGGALTREKILATASPKFICLVDDSKEVKVLGNFPVAVEVLHMARSFVAYEILKLQGRPVLRDGFTTDNGNVILDIYDWQIVDPLTLEQRVNNIPGVVGCGLFAKRIPDTILVGTNNTVVALE